MNADDVTRDNGIEGEDDFAASRLAGGIFYLGVLVFPSCPSLRSERCSFGKTTDVDVDVAITTESST
jgi:hypothetical protein